jgi:hypothetical protein
VTEPDGVLVNDFTGDSVTTSEGLMVLDSEGDSVRESVFSEDRDIVAVREFVSPLWVVVGNRVDVVDGPEESDAVREADRAALSDTDAVNETVSDRENVCERVPE